MSVLVVFLYMCATLQFIRYYCKTTIFYLSMKAYLGGHERLPFQERILPVLLMRAVEHTHWLMKFAQNNTVFTRDTGAFYLVSFVALVVAGIYTQKLYAAVSQNQSLALLVYPVFLFTVMWTYCIHLEADYSYPYDMLSLAFFTAGLYYIYRRNYLGVFLVILIGTFNRETTLFLIGIYILDSATVAGMALRAELSKRLDLRLVSWARTGLLFGTWLTIKLLLAHRFEHNDRSEDYGRLAENLHRLTPRLLPALLNICGYALPLVLVFRRSLRPTRFANYLLIVPLWFAVMFYSGVILETRIYGELCSFCAVSVVLILEQNAHETMTLQILNLPSDSLVSTNVMS